MLTKWICVLSLFLLIASGFTLIQAAHKNRIKVIVFDFGGVIAKTDRQEVVGYITQSLHISEQEAWEALTQLKAHHTKEQNENDFWIRFAKSKKINLPDNWLANLNEARIHAIKQIPGMIDLIKDLQKQGYQTALLSNVRKGQAEIKRQLGYYDLFHPILLSYEIGVKKPNQKAYQLLLSRLKVAPDAVIFIDNRVENIEAAQAAGIDGIVFINKDQLVKELKKREINLSSDY